MSMTTSNKYEIMDRTNVTLMCDVTSIPLSDIRLHNTTSNKTMDIINTSNQARYDFTNMHCLDTGVYVYGQQWLSR